MNTLQSWVLTPSAEALTKTLIHSLWEGAAVALALAVALSLLRSPRLRYAAASLALAVLVCGLIATFVRQLPEQPVHVRLTGSARIPVAAPFLLVTPRPPLGAQANHDLSWLPPLWLAGVLIFHLRGIASWLAARRLRTTGVCNPPDVWRERLAVFQSKLRMQRPVELLESCLAEVPVVIGYVRPVILMPVGLLAGLPVGQVEAILLHELAHIRRYDYLVNIFQIFVEGLLFYHPAVWWISNVMRTERENCCDDMVVEATGGAHEFACALTALEQRRTNSATALAATDGGLLKRIRRLLGQPEQRYTFAIPVLTVAALTLTVFTALAAIQWGPAARAQAPTFPTATPDKALLLAQAQPQGESSPAPSATGPAVESERKQFVEQFWLRRDPATGTILAQAQPQFQPPAPTLQPDRVMYDRAIANIDRGQYEAARLTLNTMLNTYPNSALAPKAKLAIADSWFREGGEHGRAHAIVEYRDFILFYPNLADSQEARLKLAAIAPYDRWALEDAVYIISSEERRAFNQLTTDEERAKFVEQFWDRRNPTPGSSDNPFKQEHYRRIAYANNHFTDSKGLPGWRTDRGRIYIQYGPPDEIEAHSSGGSYKRPVSEGGGETETYPFEQWRYRLIDGVGQNVILEFVDKNRTGDYLMTMDPSEKDALRKPPGAVPGR